MDVVKENFNLKQAKSAWLSAADDFKMVAALAEIGAAQGSIDSYMKEGDYGAFAEAYDIPADSSNFQSCVPLLYCLVNGIELFIKASEYAAYPDRAPNRPQKLPELIEAFKSAPYPKNEAVLALVEKYTGDQAPELMQRFLENSGKSMADLLVMRRHIGTGNFFSALEAFEPLVYTEEEGRLFFSALHDELSAVIACTDELFFDIDEDGNPGALVEALHVPEA